LIILVNEALFLVPELRNGLVTPPLSQISMLIISTTWKSSTGVVVFIAKHRL